MLRSRARVRASTYTFGDFELDAARFELRRQGVVVVIQPKALRLLLHLIVPRERAVAADELFAELWPNERVCDVLSKLYGSCLPEARLSGRVVLCLDQPAR